MCAFWKWEAIAWPMSVSTFPVPLQTCQVPITANSKCLWAGGRLLLNWVDFVPLVKITLDACTVTSKISFVFIYLYSSTFMTGIYINAWGKRRIWGSDAPRWWVMCVCALNVFIEVYNKIIHVTIWSVLAENKIRMRLKNVTGISTGRKASLSAQSCNLYRSFFFFLTRFGLEFRIQAKSIQGGGLGLHLENCSLVGIHVRIFFYYSERMSYNSDWFQSC